MLHPQRIAGRFLLEAEAAKGGMGTVYRALDQKTNRRVAVKVLRKREIVSAGRFVREAALLAELSHPGIVEYVAHGTTTEGLHYLVMEWVEGVTLAERLAEERLSPAEAVTMGIQVADALAVAHQRGVVHRDIKPTNLMFLGGSVDKVKVLDFGIARRAHEAGGLTQTGVMVGTMGYMSPEQARGTRTEKMEPQIDVFALGCVLYECLTGRTPFVGENLMAVRAKILYAEPTPLDKVAPNVPAALSALVMTMLAKPAQARPADGAAAAAALRALAPSLNAPVPPVAAAPTLPSITANVQRTCVILISAMVDEPDDDETEVEPLDMEAEVARIKKLAAPFGGVVDALGEGSLIVTLRSPGTAVEQAHTAARCALAIQPHIAAGTISITTERPDEGTVIDRLLDRGAHTLGMGMASIDDFVAAVGSDTTVWIDDETARLIEQRYDVRRNTAGYRLYGPR